MNLFEKTTQDEQKFAEFTAKIDSAVDTLSPYSDYVDLSLLKKVRESFTAKTDDFFRLDRKLNIGVIGQVKAGKSTFLNTLLFGGKKVLPSAATPKTASLTKIEYSEENKLVIEYYSAEEWRLLEDNAKVESEENEFVAAREIMKMCSEKGIDPYKYISEGSGEIRFDSAEQLMERLDDYVGEDGTYTALVKNVTIYINNPDLKDISVVDTPGLNDAIVSRTDRTRQFIELCDVVFFLSRTSQFLDKNDMRLLTSQLPQKGVKRVVMVGSQFDGAIHDNIYNCDSISEAITQTAEQLRDRARSIFSRNDTALGAVADSCRNPIFISAMCHNMSEKDSNEYDSQERCVDGNLNEYGDLTKDVLKNIGNIDEVRGIYERVIAEKDETMSEKARGFIPTSENELKTVLDDMKNSAQKNAELLRSSDKEELTKQKNFLSSQINGIKSSAEMVFGEMLASIERSKIETLHQLRDISLDCAKLNDKQGSETHTSSHRVSDSKWYRPSTWGKSHVEYSSYTTSYTYVDASDALENIRNFSNEACSGIEKSFYDSVDIIGTKRKLLNVIVENFDTSNEMYDPQLFRLLTEQTLNQIEFPVMDMDVSAEQSAISSKFSGEIRSGSDRSALRSLLADAIQRLLKTFEGKFTNEVAAFRKIIETMKNDFASRLIGNIEAEFDRLVSQLENKENEIRNYENILALFSNIK